MASHPIYKFNPDREKSFAIRCNTANMTADGMRDALARHAQACHGGEVKEDCQGCVSLRRRIEAKQ